MAHFTFQMGEVCRPLHGLNMSAHGMRGWEIPRGTRRGKMRAPPDGGAAQQ